MTAEQREALAKQIVDSTFEVHCELGPGLLEAAYEAAFCRDGKPLGFLVNFNVPLIKRGIKRRVHELKAELFRTRRRIQETPSFQPSRSSRPSR